MATSQIATAFEQAKREQRWTKAEKQAFEEFVSRIRDLESTKPTSDEIFQQNPQPTHLLPTGGDSSAERPTAEVRKAYVETVMDTAVHKYEYDEPLEESLASEFTLEIAAAILKDGPVTPQLKMAMLDSIEQSQQQRTRTLRLFEDELDSLEQARNLQERIETALAELDRISLETWHAENVAAARERLLGLEDDCERLVCNRQEMLRERPPLRGSTIDHETVAEYLYEGCSFDYPVLAAAAEWVESLRERRQQMPELAHVQ